MCTVTYIPTNKGFVITSNRDENINRPSAISPMQYHHGFCTLIYPKDAKKQGTWIAASHNGDVGVLLNGGFEKHTTRTAYRKSRGMILLELIGNVHPLIRWSTIDLDNIEPFKWIYRTGTVLVECVWDGLKKHQRNLDINAAHIWSSTTLYDHQARNARKQWFKEWRQSQKEISERSILDFHLNAGKNDLHNGLIIDRKIIKTQSITQVEYSGKRISMRYHDLLTGITDRSEISPSITRKPARKTLLNWKCFAITVMNWEYWPFILVYGPILPYWFWLGIRSRSFFFFNASNPSIEFGGFVLESKKRIYEIMPQKHIPKTAFITKSACLEEIQQTIEHCGLTFPMIAKPDIGMRGLGVQLVNNRNDLEDYVKRNRVDFLLQEQIRYPNEIGIFYSKKPGAARGQITGIVSKEFLSVTGNGYSTVGELMLQNSRHVLQYRSIGGATPSVLEEIPGAGEVVQLVPYGNHARGAKFNDISHLIDERITQMADDVCNQVPGFYFGRLDIRYQTWNELCKGENFSIIELNGAGSEPAHIYDSRHTLFFAWKEIIRHWKLLQTISEKNHRQYGIPYLPFWRGLTLLRENSKYLRSNF